MLNRWYDWVRIAHEIERMSNHTKLLELESIVAHIELVIVSGNFIHFSDVLSLSLVHVCEISKYISLDFLLTENAEHFESSLRVESVTVFAFNHLLTLSI